MIEPPAKTIAVIDYGMGNLRSVAKMVSRTGSEVIITHDHDEIRRADRLILPGVGAFADAMENLNKSGLTDILNEQVIEKRKPILGICLGMHLLAKESPEVRPTKGLGWLDASLVKFEAEQGIRIPHVGWNTLLVQKPQCPLLHDMDDGATFYFVHSYYMQAHDPDIVVGTTHYGHNFCSMVQQGNIFGTQFHPEKSQSNGFLMLINFVTEDFD